MRATYPVAQPTATQASTRATNRASGVRTSGHSTHPMASAIPVGTIAACRQSSWTIGIGWAAVDDPVAILQLLAILTPRLWPI